MDNLLNTLRFKIVELLNLPDLAASDIDPDEQLVGGRLEIDSIDVLEIVVMIERDYGIAIDNKELGAKVFASLRTLTQFIHDNSPGSVD